MRLERAELRLEKAYLRLERANLRLEKANYVSERAILRLGWAPKETKSCRIEGFLDLTGVK